LSGKLESLSDDRWVNEAKRVEFERDFCDREDRILRNHIKEATQILYETHINKRSANFLLKSILNYV